MLSILINGQPIVQENDIKRFMRAVASRKDAPVWEERLGKPIVQQHLNLATVWVPFRFYLGDTANDGPFFLLSIQEQRIGFWL